MTMLSTATPLSPHDSAVPPAAPAARRWAYASALSATVGFVPLHLVWALGVPLWANPALFAAWYDPGAAAYLIVLCVLALLPAVLALALVRPWGLVFPRWVPRVGGRRVPRLLLVVPGAAVAGFLLLYAGVAAVVLPLIWNAGPAIFSPWTVVYGIVQFLIWGLGLARATRSYATRTARP